MKKKYKEGIDLFTSLLLCPLFRLAYSEVKGIRPRDRYSFLKPLVLLYKAFGELSENRP